MSLHLSFATTENILSFHSVFPNLRLYSINVHLEIGCFSYIRDLVLRSCSNTSKIFLHFKSVYLRWVSLEAKTGIGILVQMTFWGAFEAEGEGKKKARTPGKNVGSVRHQLQLIFRESLEHKSQNSIRCNLRPWGWPLQASLIPDSHWPEGNFPEEAVTGLLATLKAAVGSKHSHWRRSRQGTNSIHYSVYIPCFLLVFYPHFCRWVLTC